LASRSLAPYVTSIIVVAATGTSTAGRADPPNDSSFRNLNQRTIARAYEHGGRATLTEIAHRTVVDDPGAAVGPELDVVRTMEGVVVYGIGLYERLVTRLVEGEPHDFERKRLSKVNELDLMTDFWGWFSRIRK